MGLIRLLTAVLVLHQTIGASTPEDALAVLPTASSGPENIFLLLTLANGDLVLLDAVDGSVIWRHADQQAVIISDVDPPGSPVLFANHAVVPGLDGTLYFDRDHHALDPVQVSIKELVERAPFQTRDGTRFLSQKQTEILLLDHQTGTIRLRFQNDYGLDDNLSAARLASESAIMIGLARYTISAAGPDSSWNLSYTETVALSVAARPSILLPDLYASASGHVWARDSISERVLWRTFLGSVPASALAVVGDSTYKVHIRFGVDDDIDRPFFGPMLAHLSDGQTVVVGNRPAASTSTLSFYDPFLAIAAPPLRTALGPAQLPYRAPSSTEPTRSQRDSVHITLNLPESPIWFSLMVLASISVAFGIQAVIKRLVSRWTARTELSSTTGKKKRHKKSPSDAEDRVAAVSLTIGKIVVKTDDVLGVGSQGTIVFNGMFEGRSVAVKRLQKHLFSHATSEIALMIESDRHPSVLRYFAREDDTNFIYVAIERCVCSLADVVAGSVSKLSQPLLTLEMRPTPFALRILSDMVAGVEYLHSLSIVHKDIKPGNILITEDGTAKIADMGLSLRLDRDRSSFTIAGSGGGSAGWYAPELMRSDLDVRLTRSVDIFSIGLVIYYVLTRGLHPFGEGFERDTNIVLGRYNLDRIRHLPEAVDLVQATLSAEPQHRPLCTEVLRHPFFWSDEQKLEFLQEISDRVEIEKPDSELRLALESQAGRVVGRAWNRVIDASLVDNLGKYRKYQYDSVRDCLRVIRNKKNHYRDLPPQVQDALGVYPSGFLFYFTSRFPSLLLYTFAFAGRFCAHETPLSRHFVGLSDQLLFKHWQVWGGDHQPDGVNTAQSTL